MRVRFSLLHVDEKTGAITHLVDDTVSGDTQLDIVHQVQGFEIRHPKANASTIDFLHPLEG